MKALVKGSLQRQTFNRIDDVSNHQVAGVGVTIIEVTFLTKTQFSINMAGALKMDFWVEQPLVLDVSFWSFCRICENRKFYLVSYFNGARSPGSLAAGTIDTNSLAPPFVRTKPVIPGETRLMEFSRFRAKLSRGLRWRQKQ